MRKHTVIEYKSKVRDGVGSEQRRGGDAYFATLMNHPPDDLYFVTSQRKTWPNSKKCKICERHLTWWAACWGDGFCRVSFSDPGRPPRRAGRGARWGTHQPPTSHTMTHQSFMKIFHISDIPQCLNLMNSWSRPEGFSFFKHIIKDVRQHRG